MNSPPSFQNIDPQEPASRKQSLNLLDLHSLWGRNLNPTLQPQQRHLIPLTNTPRPHRLNRVLDFPPIQLPLGQDLQLLLLQMRQRVRDSGGRRETREELAPQDEA